MDLFACKSLLFLLVFIGCSAGQEILPEGPVDAIVGTTVTLKTLINKSDFQFIIWNFSDGKDQTNIVTQTTSGLKVNAPYEGRVSINKTNGYLTLGPLKLEDSGDYSIHALSSDGTTRTGEIKLRVLGCSAEQDILPGSLGDAILGSTVTLNTQIFKSDFVFIVWYFNVGSDQTHIATQSTSELMVNTPYEGRVCINKTNGYLTLGPLKLEDSGTYSINILSPDFTTYTEEITLRVLAPTTSSSTLQPFSTPEPTTQCTGDVGPLVACVVVIAVLLAGYLLLLCRWIKNRNLRNSNSRDIELSVPHEKRPPDSEDYQTLNPASRDQDQIYSSLSHT